jgi:predicted  nucleic acid-binding Zn-ribbon protein
MTQSKLKNRRAKQGPSKGIEHLLSEQTTVILHAVDERLSAQDKKFEARFDAIDRRFDAQDQRLEERFTAQNIAILTAVDKRFEKMEQRFMDKLNSLTNTLDRFLKRLTDTEEEFVFMKHDVNRIKAVLREKLGVALD